MKNSKSFQLNKLEQKNAVHPSTQKKWTAKQILRKETISKVKGGKGDIIIVDKDLG